ncbi:MAG: DNA polymerase III subunit delta' [bacterium]
MEFNWQFIGNQNAVAYLQNQLANNRLAHGYLFCGPEQVGKRHLANIFINSLLCEAQDQIRPCNACRHCQQLAKDIHPDIFWVKREEDKKDIWIDQVQELRNRLGMSTFLNSYKIAVVEDADRLNRASANALLKTLEEPALKTILIFLTSKIGLLPATIVSRCQVLRFKPVATSAIADYLIKRGAEHGQAEVIANLALGRPGLAVDLFQDEDWLAFYQEQVERFLEISRSDISRRFKEALVLAKEKESFSENVTGLIATLNIWQSVWRDLILIKTQSINLIKNVFVQKEMEKLAGRYSLRQLKDLILQAKETQKYLKQNVNPQLALENLMLNF